MRKKLNLKSSFQEMISNSTKTQQSTKKNNLNSFRRKELYDTDRYYVI